MKVREPRTRVLIDARMRSGAQWDDVRVLNLSPRGMLLQAARSPGRGSYVEVRRGRHVVVARVVWSEGQRFGLNTQDRVSVVSLISDTATGPEKEPTSERVERRAAPRAPAHSWERSREQGRAMEFACIAFVGVAAAMVGFGAVQSAFARPMTALNAALADG